MVMPGIEINIEANSYQDLFKKSLLDMAHKLKRGICNKTNHCDCIMRIQIDGVDSKALFQKFLNKVLDLTHTHHTIFCTMYIEELTEKKLKAQVYGNWFDTFDNKIISVSKKGFSFNVREDEPTLWKSSVCFDIEK